MKDLASKHRPKILEDVVGQPVVVRTLSNAVKAKTLHHAYLFIGQIGSGKTTVARILAAMENCTVSPGLNPCGRCDVCQGIYAGTHSDILEIDAASKAGSVKEIRELKNNALYSPIDGAKTKIYIIDESHRMSAEANDALLKILEEPPAHVRFILCTTDVQKMRPAIQSRCQRHEFRKIYWSLISEHLERVASLEKVQVDKASLNLCARLANGSMRNGLQNLAKLIDFAGDQPITAEVSQELFAQVNELMLYDLMDEVIGTKDGKPDASAGFRIINSLLASGTEFALLQEGIAEHLRSLMIGLSCSKAGDLLNVSEEGKRRLSEQLKRCQQTQKLPAVIEAIQLLNDAKSAVDFNMSAEVALQKWFLESVFAFRRQ